MGAASSLVIGQSSIAPVSPFGSANSDYDTLTNAEEITVGTSPALTDTDGDFITDSDELSITLTNPLLADSNGDGLSDYVNWVTAHPQLWDVNRNALWDARDLQFNDYSSYQGFWWATAHLIDTDGDGISDRDEFWYGNWFKYKYWHNDSDGDGILDGVEWNGPDHWLPTDYDHDGLAASSEYNTDPNNPDSDGDGLPDGVDSFFRTQAHVDSDNDGLNDLEELLNGSCPAHGDYDEDWLDDSQERILGSNPYAYDTDMDGLSDGYEFFGTLFVGPTDPLFIDSDGDFLTDFEEQWSWYTTTASYFNGNLLDPNNPDTDGDGVLDYFEVNLTDTDNGGVPDVMERYYGLNPLLSSDDIGDLDNDGETNVVEYQNGTLLDGNYGPRYDWDRDGMTNVWEIAQGLDPTDPLDAYDDPDGDYLFNIEEYQARTNPHLVLTPGAQLIVILTLDPTTFSVVHIPARTDYEAAMRSALPAGLVRGNGPDAQREHEDDWDGDGLTNRSEMLDDPFTSPRTPTADADGDSLPSAWEISMTLNPLNGDQNTSGTNDRDDDFDQDTLTNHAELLAGTHPLNSDTDADGLPDGWEISFGLNPLDASGDHGSAGDPDGDGLTNHEELVLHGTDPLNADTDDDGLPDDWELKHGLDPNNNTGPDGADGDVDGDGNSNAVEFAGGSDPRSNASRPMPEIQIRREVNWPGGSYTATEGFGFIITRAGDSSPSYEDFETDDAHDAPGRYHHAAADGDYPEIDIPMFSRYQITALGSEAMSAPLARNYLIVKKKYSSDSELISTEYGTLKVSFAHGASPAAYEVHGSMAGEFVVSGGFLEVRPHKVHNGIAMIDFLAIGLKLRVTGKIEPAPENDSYQMSATAGQGDDLGPLPMGTGRSNFPGAAYTAPLQVVGTVPIIPNANWRWERFITFRSWFIRKNAEGDGWVVSVRRPKIGPQDDHNSTDFDDDTPSAGRKIYIYDNSALAPAQGPAQSIGDFVFEKKQFTYQIETNAEGTWMVAGTLDVGQKLITERIHLTGAVSADYRGVENSCFVRLLNMTITEAEVRAIVGGDLPITFESDAN